MVPFCCLVSLGTAAEDMVEIQGGRGNMFLAPLNWFPAVEGMMINYRIRIEQLLLIYIACYIVYKKLPDFSGFHSSSQQLHRLHTLSLS